LHGRASVYESPSAYGFVRRVENTLLSADNSWWTGCRPLHARMVAEVPRALYLNYLARKSYVAALAPSLFRPLDLPGDKETTLFTILLFSLERSRPLRAPQMLGAFFPRIMQSNWRFYGHLTEPNAESRPSVLFLRTVTNSLALSIFGRRLARCFPLRRARRMALSWEAPRLSAMIEPGAGSAPELIFQAEQIESSPISEGFRQQFSSYEDYAHWIIDQHLSLVIWPREYVVQDMHLDFAKAKITPLHCLKCRVAGLEDFVVQPSDCFLVEGLQVFLDHIFSRTNRTGF